MPLEDRDPAYLWDMLEAAQTLRELIAGYSVAAYLADRKTQLAVERAIEILGEATRRVSPTVQQAHPEIPWASIIAQRNVIAHEYGEIKQDYDRISRTHFPGSYFYPDQMSFANSDALFATGDLSAAIGREYKGQCEILCFGSHPSWEIVQARFMELRNLL